MIWHIMHMTSIFIYLLYRGHIRKYLNEETLGNTVISTHLQHHLITKITRDQSRKKWKNFFYFRSRVGGIHSVLCVCTGWLFIYSSTIFLILKIKTIIIIWRNKQNKKVNGSSSSSSSKKIYMWLYTRNN